MKKQIRKIIVCIMALVLLLLLIVLVVYIMMKKTPDGETTPEQNISEQKTLQTSVLKTPIDLGDNLKLTDLSEATGRFLEDGSDEYVEKILSATFVNEGDNTIQYSLVKVNIGEDTFSFEFSTLPAGQSVQVFEKDKKSLSERIENISAQAEYLAYFQEEPSLHEQELEITIADGQIMVKNISEETINKEISLFYKNISEDIYMGGITYRFRIPPGLAPGKLYQGNAKHVSENMTKVMFVTYGE